MTETEIIPWVAIVISALGVFVNGLVLHKAMVTVLGLRLLGINGPTQRDSRWARMQDGTLMATQVIVFLSAVWLKRLPYVRSDVLDHLEWIWFVIIAVSILLGSMGLRNLWLRRIHLAEHLARHRGEARTRHTDVGWTRTDWGG